MGKRRLKVTDTVMMDRAVRTILNWSQVGRDDAEALPACKILARLGMAEETVITNRTEGTQIDHHIFMSTERLGRWLTNDDDDDEDNLFPA